MDPDDASPRLRWRLLGWLAGALLLLPVLYVAASGPLGWWYRYQYHKSDWIGSYLQTLGPLHQQPQISAWLSEYTYRWQRLPPLRFMRRQYLVDKLAEHRARLEETRKAIPEAQERLATLRLRLHALDSRASLTPEQSNEASYLRSQIAGVQRDLEITLPQWLSALEKPVQNAEEALREFDRRK